MTKITKAFRRKIAMTDKPDYEQRCDEYTHCCGRCKNFARCNDLREVSFDDYCSDCFERDY